MFTTANITYRLIKENDIEGILQLWECYSGWGSITREQFNRWYLDTPYGDCIIIVAIDDDNEVVGQEVFIPSRIVVNNREHKALRLSSPILHEKARHTPVTHSDHPVYEMLKAGIQVALQQQYSIIYMYPAHGWVTPMKLFQRFGLPKVEIPPPHCFGLSLNDPRNFFPLNEQYKISVLSKEFTNEYDNLWEKSSVSLPIHCGIVRNARWLNWKAKGHLTFEIRHPKKNELVGYICFKKNSGLIEDLLCQTEQDAEIILKMAIHVLHHLNPLRPEVSFGQITGMLTPFFKRLLKNIPFELKKFDFAFGCFSIDDNIDNEDIHPQNWYMMPND